MTTKTNTSGMTEICELTDDELVAVNGGAFNAYLKYDKPLGDDCVSGNHSQIGQFQVSGSTECKGTHY